MSYQDQCWIGKAMFVSKGNLVSELNNWWYPPPIQLLMPVVFPTLLITSSDGCSCGCRKGCGMLYYHAPTCNIPERTLQSKGLYTRVRLVLDIKEYYYLAAEYHSCKACGGTFIAWDNRILERLPDGIRLKFPVVLTYKYACDQAVTSLLR